MTWQPFAEQNPPICLDFHLSRCLEERCPFSHSYRISPSAITALRQEVAHTPCPLVLAGLVCINPQDCYFSHDAKLPATSRSQSSKLAVASPLHRRTPNGNSPTITRLPLAPSPPLQPISPLARRHFQPHNHGSTFPPRHP